MDGCGGLFWCEWMDGCWREVEGREKVSECMISPI